MWFYQGLILLFVWGDTFGDIRVHTFTGPVIGINRIFGNKPIFVFKNIPYAEPPVKDLRFKKPFNVQPWTEPPDPSRTAACPQYNYISGKVSIGEEIGTEDCLVMDIYTPKLPGDIERKYSLPVVVYFHGGQFMKGHKDQYEPLNLVKEEDIVVVIPNYRLGILGYLNLNNKESPGNMGLFDQRKALEWLSKNLEHFGGDPNRITISGHEAGSASVGLHILSKSSHPFFSAAISASGTALDPWLLRSRREPNIASITEYMNCGKETVIYCLRQRSVSQLLSIQDEYRNMSFAPTFDKDSTDQAFLPEHPSRLYKRKEFAQVPYLAGVTAEEASIEFYEKYSKAVMGSHLDKMLSYYLDPYFKRLSNTDVMIKATNYHYLRGKTAGSFLDYAPKFIELLTDFLYNSGLQETLKFHSTSVNDVWMYVFNFQGDKLLGDVLGPPEYRGKFGVSRMEDVIYLFNTTFIPIIPWDRSKRMTSMDEQIGRIWRSFIITRKSPPGRKWPSYNTTKRSYLDIGNTISLKTGYRQQDLDFWTILIPDLMKAANSKADSQVNNSKDYTGTWAMAGVAIVLAVLCVALAAAVVVTRKRIMRNCSVPICTSHDSVQRSSKV